MGYEIKTITGIPAWVDALQRTDKVSNEIDAYNRVPLIRRAVDIRCNAIAAVPFHLYRKGEQYEWDDIFQTPIKNLISQTERALLLSGAAFWLAIDNGRKRVGAQILNPLTVEVKPTQIRNQDGNYQLSLSFEQKITGMEPKTFTREQIVYFKEFNPTDDIRPGVSTTAVALADAKVMQYLTAFVGSFFEGGAMPVTILGIEGNPPQDEINKLRDFFKRIASGVKNAFNVVPMKGGTKVTPITPNMDTLALPDNRIQAIQNIAFAFGIPETMLTDAANYATATAQHRSFYEETINPRADYLADTITAQFLSAGGYSLKADPEEMSIFQEDESARAASLNQLVLSGVPLPLAMDILGYELSDEQTTMLNVDEPTSEPDNEPIAEDMAKFHRKAVKAFEKSGKAVVSFSSGVIPAEDIAIVSAKLAECKSKEDIDRAFVEYKPVGDMDRILVELKRANDLLESIRE